MKRVRKSKKKRQDKVREAKKRGVKGSKKKKNEEE